MSEKKYTGPYQNTDRMYRYYEVDGHRIGVVPSRKVFGGLQGYAILFEDIEYGIVCNSRYDRTMPTNQRYGSIFLVSSLEAVSGDPAPAELQEIVQDAITQDYQLYYPDSFVKFE